MNEYLRDLITSENVMSYSRACIDLYDILIRLKDENYKRLIIPSRGAYPFYDAALKLHYHSSNRLNSKDNPHSYFNLWLLPYTADWGQADISADAKSVRKF